MAEELDWTNARKILEGDLLSVVLPVYNLGSSIAENLESVAACLDAGGFRYELVPVDDGSADASAEAIRAYADSFTSRHAAREAWRDVKPSAYARIASALPSALPSSTGTSS